MFQRVVSQSVYTFLKSVKTHRPNYLSEKIFIKILCKYSSYECETVKVEGKQFLRKYIKPFVRGSKGVLIKQFNIKSK